MYKRLLILLGCGLLLTGILATACTSSDSKLKDRVGTVESQQTALSEQLATINDSLQQQAMLTAVDNLDAAGLHALAEALAAGEDIPEGSSGPVDRALLAMAVVEWPADLQADADNMQSILQDLSTALHDADSAAATPASDAAHEAQHDFSDKVRDTLSTDAGLSSGADGEASTTPEAGSTAESGSDHDEGDDHTTETPGGG